MGKRIWSAEPANHIAVFQETAIRRGGAGRCSRAAC